MTTFRSITTVANHVAAGATALLVVACQEQSYDLDQITPSSCDAMTQFAIDGDRLYWIEQQGFGAVEHVLVTCEPQNCGDTRRQYASLEVAQPNTTTSIAAGNGHLFWAYGAAGGGRGMSYVGTTDSLYKVPLVRRSIWWLHAGKDGPAPFFEFPGAMGCMRIAFDGHELFCADTFGNILAFSIDSEPAPRVVAMGHAMTANDRSSQLLTHDGDLYWIEGAVIRRVRKAGSQPIETVMAHAGATSLAVDGSFSYWLDEDSMELRRCEPADCAATWQTLAHLGDASDSSKNPNSPLRELRLQAGVLYWLAGDWLYRCPADGCLDGPERVTSEQVAHFAVDEDHLYLVVRDEAPRGEATASGSAPCRIQGISRQASAIP